MQGPRKVHPLPPGRVAFFLIISWAYCLAVAFLDLELWWAFAIVSMAAGLLIGQLWVLTLGVAVVIRVFAELDNSEIPAEAVALLYVPIALLGLGVGVGARRLVGSPAPTTVAKAKRT
jgi:hypothetical protein